MENLKVKIREKIKALSGDTKESRFAKGAYVDCIIMIDDYSMRLKDKDKELAVKFAEWLLCTDNGTEFYNPKTKKTSESIGFCPYTCYVDGLKTKPELLNFFLTQKQK